MNQWWRVDGGSTSSRQALSPESRQEEEEASRAIESATELRVRPHPIHEVDDDRALFQNVDRLLPPNL